MKELLTGASDGVRLTLASGVVFLQVVLLEL